MEARKIWERLQSSGAPHNQLYRGISELAIELAMRGKGHVMEGLSRGARQAFKNWRAQVHNANQNAEEGGQWVSMLYREFEEAIALCRRRNPSMNCTEPTGWRRRKEMYTRTVE